ncbi:MAG: hypothetical protein PVF58_22500, partial [Candidatus Methanofastidiosia archaeon]
MKYSKIFLVVLLFISLLNGCINQRHTGRLVYFEEFDVTFEELPLLNKSVNLVCTVTQMEHSSERFLKEDVVLEVELPEGFELVDGTLTWEGHLDANQIKTHIVTVKAVKTGRWTIRVWGGPSGSPKFELKNLYVTVTETSARVSTKPFKKNMITDSKSHTGDLSYFKDFNISLSDLPILNYHTTLNCTVTQMEHSSERFLKEDVVLEVELPEGFELVDGT